MLEEAERRQSFTFCKTILDFRKLGFCMYWKRIKRKIVSLYSGNFVSGAFEVDLLSPTTFKIVCARSKRKLSIFHNDAQESSIEHRDKREESSLSLYSRAIGNV